MDLSRGLASHYGITSLVANEFWEELRPWCINTGKHQTRCVWHHGELGGNVDLVAKWDAMLFKIASCFYSSTVCKSMLPYFYDLVTDSSRGQQSLPFVQPGKRSADTWDLVAWFKNCLLVPELPELPAPAPVPEDDPMQEDLPEDRDEDNPNTLCSPASTVGDGKNERLNTPGSSYEPDHDDDEEPLPPSPLPGHEPGPSSASVGALPAVNLAVPPNSTRNLHGTLYTEMFYADENNIVERTTTPFDTDDAVPDDSVRATVEETRGFRAAASDAVAPPRFR